jgi:uncharacterized protein (UPF0335 family)
MSSNSVAGERLLNIIERYEQLETEKVAIADAQKDVMLEAKSAGFDVKVVREVLKRRKAGEAVIDQFEMLVQTYEQALKDAWNTTPLAAAAQDGDDE